MAKYERIIYWSDDDETRQDTARHLQDFRRDISNKANTRKTA